MVVADVLARRLGSPLDAALRLVGADGTVVAFNDDSKDLEMGLLTHHADPALQAELPRDGLYRACLWDAQRHGGEPYAYRLRLRTPQPDFALRLTPSCVNVRPGQAATLTVHALRKDGFAQDIDLRLLDAPDGFVLNGTRIPAGKDSLEVRLSAPRGVARQVFPVRLEGRAVVGGETVSRLALAAEDMMQAFLWRFLVPRQELLVAVAGTRPVPTVWRPLLPGARLTSATPVRVPLGGTARVEIAAPQTLADPARTALTSVRFRLANQSRGVTLRDAGVGPAGIALELKADANCALPGDAANVIVEAYADAVRRRRQPGAVSPSASCPPSRMRSCGHEHERGEIMNARAATQEIVMPMGSVRRRLGMAPLGLAAALLLASAGVLRSADTLTAKLDASGMIQISRAGVELAMIELNAHGSGWQHAPQRTATAEVGDLPGQTGKQFAGVLPIPKSEGGAIRYTERVKALPQGFQLEYDLAVTQPVRLSGLQFSVSLPVAPYAGKEVLVSQLGDEPELVGLPQEQSKDRFQLWSGQGARVEVNKGGVAAITVELRAAADVVVQDLRQWGNPVYEIHVPAIMEDPGREVSAADRFHLDVTVTFASPVKLEGP